MDFGQHIASGAAGNRAARFQEEQSIGVLSRQSEIAKHDHHRRAVPRETPHAIECRMLMFEI
jgi:hypothetical protein